MILGSAQKRPKKILFIIGQLDIGGAEKHLVTIATELKRRGWNPEIFCLNKEGPLAANARESGVPVYSSRFLGKPILEVPQWTLRVLGAFISLSKHLLFRRPDLIHFFLPDAYVFGGFCAILFGVRPRIMSRRSLNNYQTTRSPWLEKAERFLHPRMTLISGNSQAVIRQLIEEGAEKNRLRLIYNGVDQDRFKNLPERQAIRAGIGIDRDTLVLIMVANIIPYKGHQLLLQALANISPNLHDNWRLLLIGRDDGIGNELRAFAEKHHIASHITWMGPRTDVPQLFAASDIGIHCSHEEGFSNAILEGMAAGLPMIVTDVGGNPEAIEQGRSGVIIPSNDVAALGREILRLCDSPQDRAQFGHSAKLRVVHDFSPQKCFGAYEEMYDEALALKK